MFEIDASDKGTIRLSGRLDASQTDRARAILDQVRDSCVVDFTELKYISSAGLGVLFAAQKRLVDAGRGLKLVNLNPHIRELFTIAGFDSIFEIE